jgi:hypothetical protein
MKKFFSIIALSAMTLSLSSFDNNEVIENPHDDCVAEANAHGEFMDGYNGVSSIGHAFAYYSTFCHLYPI